MRLDSDDDGRSVVHLTQGRTVTEVPPRCWVIEDGRSAAIIDSREHELEQEAGGSYRLRIGRTTVFFPATSHVFSVGARMGRSGFHPMEDLT